MSFNQVTRDGWTPSTIAQVYFEKIQAGEICCCPKCSKHQGDHLLLWLAAQGFCVVPIETKH